MNQLHMIPAIVSLEDFKQMTQGSLHSDVLEYFTDQPRGVSRRRLQELVSPEAMK